MMTPGFQLEMLWHDVDIVKLRVSASNGVFAGTADVYLGAGQMQEMVASLAGFPRSPSDTRELVLGSFGAESAGGAMRLRFFCAAAAGHTCVDCEVESDGEVAGVLQHARFVVTIDAAALADFLEQLRSLDMEKSPNARLTGAGA